jgi:hypothetical protein
MEHMSYAKGISWIDDCRIPFVDGGWGERRNGNDGLKTDEYGHKKINQIQNTQGRFPANILVCDDMLNDGIITKQSQRTYKPTDKSASLFGNSPQAHGTGIGDKGTNSRYYDIDKWFENLLDSCE